MSGVPQGTVLGPLLFSLYINDIASDIESEIRLFADDCVCYHEIKDEEDTMKLQRDIDQLGSWASKWGMRFQPVKCSMMQLTRKRIKKIHASYTLEGTDLENVESIKYPGVTITSDLRWNTHVSNVCTKANRTLGFLRRNLYSCPQEVKEAAYKGLVRPVLDYGSSVWDSPGVVLQEELQSVHITETSPCAIGNFRKWLLYKCFMSLSLIVIQTNIKFLNITVTWTNIW